MVSHCAFTSDGMLIASGAAITEKMPVLEKKKEEEIIAVFTQEKVQ